MSLRWAILGSGSQANSYVFQEDGHAVVIDAGFPLRTFHKRCAKAGIDHTAVKTVLLTHNHGDHVRGLETLLAATGAQLIHRRALNVKPLLRRWKEPSLMPVEAGESYKAGPLDFFPFDLSHDAPAATGYHFKIGGVRFTLITDTGTTDAAMLRLAARSDVLFLESNYCPVMLETGRYPEVLKQRVASDRGHLSNHQAAAFLNTLADLKARGETNLKSVYLVHLSANNNTPERVAEVLKAECRWPGLIRVCRRSELVVGTETEDQLGEQAVLI